MAKKPLITPIRSQFNRLHLLALVVLALGVIFVSYNYNQQYKHGVGTPKVMERFVITKMYNIIEERNALMFRASSILQLRFHDILGTFLVDQNSRTLYSFKKDSSDESFCYDECAKKWPPVWMKGNIVLTEGVQGELGIIGREDGPGQVIYDDTPLYYYEDDVEMGDTSGHGVDDLWSVVRP